MAKNPPKPNQPKKRAKREKTSKSAPGVGLRAGSNVYRLSYTVDGTQVRVSLGTTNYAEACKLAEVIRGKPAVDKKTGQVIKGKTKIERELERYWVDRLGTGKKKMNAFSLKNAEQSVRDYAAAMGATDPIQVTTETLAEYYQKLSGLWNWKKNEVPWKTKSESTAQTYTRKTATFIRWCGFAVKSPDFEETPTRKHVISSSRTDELLTLSAGDLKFVHLCGLRAGMRRGEISWARPEWFRLDLDEPCIQIPSNDRISKWRPKSRRAREIPLVSEFVEFIKSEYPDWHTRKYCIRPTVNPAKKAGIPTAPYRFDTRKMFSRFSRTHCPELTHHGMRHTYASILANNGVPPLQIAAWVGDKIETLAKHYLHLQTDAKKAEDAFSAHRRPTARQAQETMAAQQETLAQQQGALAAQNGELKAKVNWLSEIMAAQAAQLGISTWQDTAHLEDSMEDDEEDEEPTPAPKPRGRSMIYD